MKGDFILELGFKEVRNKTTLPPPTTSRKLPLSGLELLSMCHALQPSVRGHGFQELQELGYDKYESLFALQRAGNDIVNEQQ